MFCGMKNVFSSLSYRFAVIAWGAIKEEKKPK